MTRSAVTSTASGAQPGGAEDGTQGDKLRGRAGGAAVCAVMGLIWAATASAGLGVRGAVAAMVPAVALTAFLIAGARRLRSIAAALPPSASAGADPSSVRRRFNVAVLGEFVAILVAVNILVRSGHPEWIPSAVCAAVGLHFLPLARLFKLPLFHGTALALCLVAASTVLIAGAVGSPTLWRLLPGFGAALTLWATGLLLLVTPEAPNTSR